MTTHSMRLNTPWYEYVKSGEKIYEGRRISDKVLAINPGDKIEFCHATDQDRDLPISEVLPIIGINIDKGDEIYKKYVSIATQNKDGVAMIKIKNPIIR